MFCLPEQFFMLVLAHLFLTPFHNATHRLTSFFTFVYSVVFPSFPKSVIANPIFSVSLDPRVKPRMTNTAYRDNTSLN